MLLCLALVARVAAVSSQLYVVFVSIVGQLYWLAAGYEYLHLTVRELPALGSPQPIVQ